jgi:hypothetical protein
MTEIVEQSGGQNGPPLLRRQLKRGAHLIRKIVGAQGMLQASVVSSRKNIMGQTKLMDPVKALHLRPFEQLEENTLDLHAAMDGVMDDLGGGHVRLNGPVANNPWPCQKTD